MKAGALLLGALLLFSGCSTCKSFSFPNDTDDRPLCRVYGSTYFQVVYQEEDYQVEFYANVQIEYQFTFPDNTVMVVPKGLTWKDLQCLKDPVFCFNDNAVGSQFRSHSDKIGLPDGPVMLWRI
jgi:hypothetical protein